MVASSTPLLRLLVGPSYLSWCVFSFVEQSFDRRQKLSQIPLDVFGDFELLQGDTILGGRSTRVLERVVGRGQRGSLGPRRGFGVRSGVHSYVLHSG